MKRYSEKILDKKYNMNIIEIIKGIQERLHELIDIEDQLYLMLQKYKYTLAKSPESILYDIKRVIKKVQRNISYELKVLSKVVHNQHIDVSDSVNTGYSSTVREKSKPTKFSCSVNLFELDNHEKVTNF